MRWRLWLGFKSQKISLDVLPWEKNKLGKRGERWKLPFFKEGGGGFILGQGIWGFWVACLQANGKAKWGDSCVKIWD
jgi:hypothetical protein